MKSPLEVMNVVGTRVCCTGALSGMISSVFPRPQEAMRPARCPMSSKKPIVSTFFPLQPAHTDATWKNDQLLADWAGIPAGAKRGERLATSLAGALNDHLTLATDVPSASELLIVQAFFAAVIADAYGGILGGHH